MLRRKISSVIRNLKLRNLKTKKQKKEQSKKEYDSLLGRVLYSKEKISNSEIINKSTRKNNSNEKYRKARKKYFKNK
jgi:hypothetical protein